MRKVMYTKVAYMHIILYVLGAAGEGKASVIVRGFESNGEGITSQQQYHSSQQ